MNMYALIASSLLGLATPIVTNVVDALGVSLEDCRRGRRRLIRLTKRNKRLAQSRRKG